MQTYRVEGGKLAQTWLILEPLGSAWSDTMAQKRKTRIGAAIYGTMSGMSVTRT